MVRITSFVSHEKALPNLGDLLVMLIKHVPKSWDDPPSIPMPRHPTRDNGGTLSALSNNKSWLVNLTYPPLQKYGLIGGY